METITITPEELAVQLDAAILKMQDSLARLKNARKALDIAPTATVNSQTIRPRSERVTRRASPAATRASRVPVADREASILHLLDTGPMTTADLSAAIGTSKGYTGRLLRDMVGKRLLSESPGRGRESTIWAKR